jgi:hypothetical protein
VARRERDPFARVWMVVVADTQGKRFPSARSCVRYFHHDPAEALRYERVRREMRPSGIKRRLRDQVN